MTSKGNAQLLSSQGDDQSDTGNRQIGNAFKDDEKQSNTIMQQINNFSLTPMNETLAKQTIEDHKYLLELVENRAAIAYFAVSNRNHALYQAMREYYDIFEESNTGEVVKEKPDGTKKVRNQEDFNDPLDYLFIKMIEMYDFMSVVMYPDLKNRREFVHDCWLIAQGKDNEELKMALSRDPYFYVNRNDLLVLLKSNDIKMITHLLSTDCMLHITTDIGYKLISIKHAQVDKNQQTVVKFLDFFSVMIENKREEQYVVDAAVIFTHKQTLGFLEDMSEYVIPEEVIKILILARKFRLSIQFLQISKAPFVIEYFTNAIEANAYDIAFYLVKVYEDEIFQNYQKAITAHVKSYQLNKRFLKSKLHMSKMLLSIFNFQSAKVFLEILQFSLNDISIEGNIFAHSGNPLLVMCLLYELLLNMIKKFYSLKNACSTMMVQIMKMSLDYIESVDDENFLTSVMIEKDYSGRDSLRIAVELELLDLIQAPKVEAIIKRIYNSDFDQAGNLFEMSTSYQIVFGNKNVNLDPEEDMRFYKKRDIEKVPQSEWLFEIFKLSMNARIKAVGILGFIFVAISAIYYEIVIRTISESRGSLQEIMKTRTLLLGSNDEVAILTNLEVIEDIYKIIGPRTESLYQAFNTIQYLCFLNLTFLFQHIVTFIFTKRLGRFYEFPVILHFTDTILFVCSLVFISWFRTNIQKDLYSSDLDATEYLQRTLSNLIANVDFPFQYLFAAQVSCLILRIAIFLQYNESIGPLIKIVGKMQQDFLNFVILYCLMTIMFGIVGNINFIYDLTEFEGMFESILTVIDASLGNYDITIFDKIPSANMASFGKIYMISIIIMFNILLMNLIIAILANTYSNFESGSTGLYLSKILSTRDEVEYDVNYGAFLSAMPPINILQIPFIGPAMSLRQGTPTLIQMNEYVMISQYVLFMFIFKALFMGVSLVLIPFAYLIGILDKMRTLGQQKDPKAKIMNNFMFLPFGIPILVFDFLADTMYFWKNNFRTDLQEIIIPKEKSYISHKSIKEVLAIGEKYIENKIKSASTKQFIRQFRRRFDVNRNIQFLIFGQFVPRGGSAGNEDLKSRQTTYKSMRTQDLEKVRQEEIQSLDDTEQLASSKHQLQQFNQMKKILMNFSFRDKNKVILSTEINWDVIDEMRKERKIVMVLRDLNIDEYIFLDMPEVDIYDANIVKECPLTLQLSIQEKLEWRERFAQKISITRLDYMLKVLRIFWDGKQTIANPDAFKEKIRRMLKFDRQQQHQSNLKRAQSSSSFGSSANLTQSGKSGLSASDANSMASSQNQDNGDHDDEEGYEAENSNDQNGNAEIIKTINEIFQEVSDQIMDDAYTRLKYLKKVNPSKKGDKYQDEELIDEVGIQD